MVEMVKPRKCRRCEGKGFVPHARDMGRCFGCDGVGEVETDRATIAAKKVRAQLRKDLGTAAFAHSTEAHLGLNRLEADSPARLAKALDSFAAGRTDLLEALAAYGVQA